MDFRLELNIKPWKERLHLRQKVMLMGSCFTEHMSQKLTDYRFKTLENPHGILFNPQSILQALEAYASRQVFESDGLFYYDGLWQSWAHHGRFAHGDPAEALKKINTELAEASVYIREADWLIITLGSAFVYELKPGTAFGQNGAPMAVANCHKVPQGNFIHRLLSYEEVCRDIGKMVQTVRAVNPGLKIIFTISPVRHHREGLVENNRSKALLHLAVMGQLQTDGIYYFPAYELVVDDLRDYRFFAEDLVHPNYLATQYVWEKFSMACISEESKLLMEKINRLNAAMQHRPRQPESANHKAFLAKMLKETIALKTEAPYLELPGAIAFFGERKG